MFKCHEKELDSQTVGAFIVTVTIQGPGIRNIFGVHLSEEIYFGSCSIHGVCKTNSQFHAQTAAPNTRGYAYAVLALGGILVGGGRRRCCMAYSHCSTKDKRPRSCRSFSGCDFSWRGGGGQAAISWQIPLPRLGDFLTTADAGPPMARITRIATFSKFRLDIPRRHLTKSTVNDVPSTLFWDLAQPGSSSHHV
ncbi:uncharacterized protein LACBIDRAFT_332744 [Laccaria bicolor S238N-H82]|uniref:Predicted protein n=1 Tax=Laccaria bicolor (strain S238N-H82 / ATCC MYA-4686) TaxID=486041 RepID=B0DTY2_LACBS|nr:uncharacterized protein LACBIDRAFT_332744 [Laccaria bicolor S238N-H82]EDR01929.1 predicted protein [Laccaria bicolor S238N-H82]|eukprot:XP_001887320.1 predicted protein [Laccaria bicolor S238N-H82]